MINYTDKDWDVLYDIYSNKYNRSSKYARRYDAEPADTKMTKSQFKTSVTLNEQVLKGSGEFKGFKKLAEDLARQDVYQYSTKQATNWARVLRENDEANQIDLGKLRVQGMKGSAFGERIIKRYNQLKEDTSLTTTQVARVISQEFYGSD